MVLADPDGGREIDAELLAEIGTPVDGEGGDKFDRGQVIVVGGDRESPGGAVLAALAALRAGAGRARIVTDGAIAPLLAAAVPEIRVSAYADAPAGPDLHASEALAASITTADAVLVGSGDADRDRAGRLLEQVVDLLSPEACLLVDAAALPFVACRPGLLAGLESRVVLLPNPGETAHLLGRGIDDVEADPAGALGDAVDRYGVAIAVRGQTTWIGDSERGPYVERGGHAALGTSGSGDVLAGMVSGLAARGAPTLPALVWAVHAHASCGRALAARDHGIGLLARELLDVVAPTLNELLAR